MGIFKTQFFVIAEDIAVTLIYSHLCSLYYMDSCLIDTVKSLLLFSHEYAFCVFFVWFLIYNSVLMCRDISNKNYIDVIILTTLDIDSIFFLDVWYVFDRRFQKNHYTLVIKNSQ